MPGHLGNISYTTLPPLIIIAFNLSHVTFSWYLLIIYHPTIRMDVSIYLSTKSVLSYYNVSGLVLGPGTMERTSYLTPHML